MDAVLVQVVFQPKNDGERSRSRPVRWNQTHVVTVTVRRHDVAMLLPVAHLAAARHQCPKPELETLYRYEVHQKPVFFRIYRIFDLLFALKKPSAIGGNC